MRGLAPAGRGGTVGRMRKILLVAGCILAGLGGVASANAQIVAEPAAVDLGRQPQQRVAEGKVTLINTGKEAVTIFAVQPDCSCTVGTLEKQTLEPGERTELTINVETRVYQGEITRQLTLRTSAGDVLVPVKVLITPYEYWSLRPPFLTLAPSSRDKEMSGEVVLDYLGTQAVDVTAVESAEPWIGGAVERRGGKTFAVKLTKKAGAPAGHHMVKLTALTTDAVNPRVAFNVFMTVTSLVSVKPSPLIFPTGKVGTEMRLRAELLGWDGSLPPRFELDRGEATVLGAGKEGLAFEVTMTPEKPGATTALLRVYAGDTLEVEVPVIFRAE